MGSVDPLFDMVLLELGMNDASTGRKMLDMRLPERNILNDLRQIFLAANSDIPRIHVETYKQRYNKLCNQLDTITLLMMFYPK